MAAMTWLWIGVAGTHLAVIFGFLLTERRSPTATLAWLMVLLFLPLVGLLIYFVLGATRANRIRKKSESVATRIDDVLSRHGVSGKMREHGAIPQLDPSTRALVALGRRTTSLPASYGNRATILDSAAATYRAIMRGIDDAEDHIHVEYYIIQPDRIGRALRDRLVRRAADGLAVRVLCDAVGSSKLPSNFWAPLEEAGGQAAVFNPIRFRIRRRDRVDFRNHRKIVVFDGKVGLTGGINMGREYLGLDPEIGKWRDSHISIGGPAVLGLQQTFAEDWLFTTGELLDDLRYYPNFTEVHGTQIVDIIDSGPDRQFSSVHQIFFQSIALSQKRVWVTSPYFVPDPVIEESLIAAALRGVDVRLLVPFKSDVPIISMASRSYYPRLLEAGVRIFEYERGFVHAKTLVVDEWVGTIGSANMDIRSFKLNFEVNAMVYGAEFARELAGQFLEDLKFSREITAEAVAQTGYTRRLAQAFARLLSPLL
jgi:cardiolipin synthase